MNREAYIDGYMARPNKPKLPIEMMQFEDKEEAEKVANQEKESRDIENLPYRPTAEAFLRNPDSSLAAKIMRMPGKSFIKSPGGGIDPGESPEEGLMREIQEETGIRPKNLKLHKQVNWDWPESWPVTDKQKKRYQQFRGESSHIFTGDVGDVGEATSQEGDAWEEPPSMDPEEAVDYIKRGLDPKDKTYQGEAFDKYKQAQLSAILAMYKKRAGQKVANQEITRGERNTQKPAQFGTIPSDIGEGNYQASEGLHGAGMDMSDDDFKKQQFKDKKKATTDSSKRATSNGQYTSIGDIRSHIKIASIKGIATGAGAVAGASAGALTNLLASKLFDYEGDWQTYLGAAVGGATVGGAGTYGIYDYFEKNPDKMADILEKVEGSDGMKAFEEWQKDSALMKPVRQAAGRVFTNVKDTGSYDPAEIGENIKKKGIWNSVKSIWEDKPIYNTNTLSDTYDSEAGAVAADALTRKFFDLQPRPGDIRKLRPGDIRKGRKKQFNTPEDAEALFDTVNLDPKQLKFSQHPEARKIEDRLRAIVDAGGRYEPIIGGFGVKDNKISDSFDFATNLPGVGERGYMQEPTSRSLNALRNIFSRGLGNPATVNVDL